MPPNSERNNRAIHSRSVGEATPSEVHGYPTSEPFLKSDDEARRMIILGKYILEDATKFTRSSRCGHDELSVDCPVSTTLGQDDGSF